MILPDMDEWLPDFLMRSPAFEPLRAQGAALGTTRWPTLDEMQAVFDARWPPPVAASGVPLRLVGQGGKPRSFEDKYEARVYLKGELQTRSGNWHDLFNALVWLTFPRAKAALNERHYRALRQQQAAGASNRGAAQDAMTLFDEGGVVVAASDRELLGMLRGFEWKTLFWRNRARVRAGMHFYLFGHALYEKALRPFAGITGRAMLFEVEPGLLTAPLAMQLEKLDTLVAQRLRDEREIRTTRDLAPLPVLGVPGWWPDNEHEAYYDDTAHFRPGRGSAPAVPSRTRVSFR
ncbi:MAG: DUF3025 domain-containing protein [Burkholderiales bacterium]